MGVIKDFRVASKMLLPGGNFLWGAMTLVFFLSSTAALATPSMDLLEVPALSSERSSKALLLEVARAGERLVAVGERGIIVLSDDQGAHWRQGQVPLSVTLTSVFFIDSKLGWVVGHDGVILKTRDGGEHWHKVLDGHGVNALVLEDLTKRVASLAEDQAQELEALQLRLEDVEAGASFGASRPLLAVRFENAQHGYAVGAFGQLLETHDGGDSWVSHSSALENPESYHLNAISQLAAGQWMIAGEGGTLWRTANDGLSWQRLDTGYDGHLYGVLRVPSGAFLAYGFAGNLLRSSDGTHWQRLPQVNHKSIVGGFNTVDGSTLLVARDGGLLKSHNDALTFEVASGLPGRATASMLPMLPEGTAVVSVGRGGVIVSDLTKAMSP